MAFCQLIAQAFFPVDEKALCGIACIVAKRVDCVPAVQAPRRALNETLPLFSGGKLEHLILSPQSTDLFPPFPGEQQQLPDIDVVLPLQYGLTEDDRRFLTLVLSSLPPLQFPIAMAEETLFIDAWRKLPNRPRWEPVLITESMIEARKARQREAMLVHRRRLQSEIDHGRIVAVDATHSPVARLLAGCFVPRAQAIEYLHRIGISHHDEPANDQDPVSHDVESESAAPGKGERGVGEPKLTDADRKKIVKLSMELEAKGAKAPRKTVAAELGVTVKTVYNELVKAGVLTPKKRNPRIDQRLAGKRS